MRAATNTLRQGSLRAWFCGVALPLATSGCGRTWTKKGATARDFAADHNACRVALGQSGVYYAPGLLGAAQQRDFMDECLYGKGWTEGEVSEAETKDAPPPPVPNEPVAKAGPRTVHGIDTPGYSYSFVLPDKWIDATNVDGVKMHHTKDFSHVVFVLVRPWSKSASAYVAATYPTDADVSSTALGKHDATLVVSHINARWISSIILVEGGTALDIACNDANAKKPSADCARIIDSVRIMNNEVNDL
jgi:hypothetical protein